MLLHSFKDFEESVAGFSKRIAITVLSLIIVWLSILAPTQKDFMAVVELTEGLSERGRNIVSTDDGASLYANNLRNDVVQRARRSVEKCENAAFKLSEDSPPLDEQDCGLRPGDSLWEFYRFANENEVRAFDAAIEKAEQPRVLRQELLALATFEIVGTKIVFPRLWGPPIWLMACFGALYLLRRFVARLLDASNDNHRFKDEELVRLQEHWTIRVSEKESSYRLELSTLSGFVCIVMIFLIGHVAYQGFLVGHTHWTVRRAAGFVGDYSEYFLGVYLVTTAMFALASLSVLLTTVYEGNPFRIGSKRKPNSPRRRALVAAIPSALIVFVSQRSVNWEHLSNSLRERRKRRPIRTMVSLPKGLYEIPPLPESREKRKTLVYIDDNHLVHGKSYVDPSKLTLVSRPHMAEIADFNAEYGGVYRSRAIEETALDLFEQGDISNCIIFLKKAIRFDITQSGLAAYRRVSVRLMDLCALIILRHRNNEDVSQFARWVKGLWDGAQEYRSRDQHETKRIRSRIQKWAGHQADELETVPWVEAKSGKEKVPWFCPRGRTKNEAREVRI